MLKDQTTLDCACRVLKYFESNPGPIPSRELLEQLPGSGSYMLKVLSRMAAAGLLRSGPAGYELARPLAQLNMADLLRLSIPPGGALPRLQQLLLELAATLPLQQVL